MTNAPKAPPTTPEWIATVAINNGDREFKPDDPITPDDLPAEVWDALVGTGRIAKPTPPAPPRKKALYRVVADVLHGDGRSWRRGTQVEEGELDPAVFSAALAARHIEAAGDPIEDRVALVSAEIERLRSRLDRRQKSILRQAHAGAAPIVLDIGPWNNETGMTASIEMIEGAARAMLEAPPRDEWPDWGKELPRLLKWIGHWREARAAGHIDSVGLYAMSIGMMFTRMAFLLIDGKAIARSASARLNQRRSHNGRRENEAERKTELRQEVLRLDLELRTRRPRLKSRSDRAEHILAGVSEWLEAQGRPPIAARTIRGMLPAVE